ncbi:hypothetical protein Pfo_031209 [Paulownia fortunei]|nr:hypothetical protein Pfo_031209 [Paulownia fortunei]
MWNTKKNLYHILLAFFRSKTQIILITTVFGVVFAIISAGKTTHSQFKIPIDAIESNQCTMSKQTVKNIDKLLKDVMKNDKDFGGKVVVFCENFRHVLIVVPKVTIYQNIFASLVTSYLFPKMKKKYFIKEHESRNDPNFSEFLLRVEKGEEPSDTKGNIKILEDMIIKYDNEEKLILRLIRAIFPNLIRNADSIHYMTRRTILNAKNEHVDKLNNKLIFIFVETVDDMNNYHKDDDLNSLTSNGLHPHKLALRKKCRIILLMNLDQSNGLCNDTRMLCRTSWIV